VRRAHTIRRVPEVFFVPEGDHYVPTELTRGPWDPDSQHAGPPAALIGREIAWLNGGVDRRVGRITYEILRPVPIAPLTVTAEVVRPGRTVELVEASLADEQGEVIRARAWRLREGDVDIPEGLSSEDGPGTLGSSPSTLRPGGAERVPAGDVPGHRAGRRLPHRDGVPVRERRLRRARAGDRLDAHEGAAGGR
jgi:hypothetical protein